jgi:hypothetical protein
MISARINMAMAITTGGLPCIKNRQRPSGKHQVDFYDNEGTAYADLPLRLIKKWDEETFRAYFNPKSKKQGYRAAMYQSIKEHMRRGLCTVSCFRKFCTDFDLDSGVTETLVGICEQEARYERQYAAISGIYDFEYDVESNAENTQLKTPQLNEGRQR